MNKPITTIHDCYTALWGDDLEVSTEGILDKIKDRLVTISRRRRGKLPNIKDHIADMVEYQDALASRSTRDLNVDVKISAAEANDIITASKNALRMFSMSRRLITDFSKLAKIADKTVRTDKALRIVERLTASLEKAEVPEVTKTTLSESGFNTKWKRVFNADKKLVLAYVKHAEQSRKAQAELDGDTTNLLRRTKGAKILKWMEEVYPSAIMNIAHKSMRSMVMAT